MERLLRRLLIASFRLGLAQLTAALLARWLQYRVLQMRPPRRPNRRQCRKLDSKPDLPIYFTFSQLASRELLVLPKAQWRKWFSTGSHTVL
ncbi:uncharacterized protein BCR38DRAFT_442249 [Pseudomassariella vexata]|uniref:Uncharacterized protein n=1 Tax=Pseudomassariella vexata TaxID=1141098 RepID=A0A1Y2DNG7_9PEZI|nr:uncharacterized protein BCR38DRAFT_442249 [Pseudomassariella vexata]ORY60704.1 hypothetical protein BCR38DRAFT_442249 [Pseudomassariella vexata]